MTLSKNQHQALCHSGGQCHVAQKGVFLWSLCPHPAGYSPGAPGSALVFWGSNSTPCRVQELTLWLVNEITKP